MVATALTLAAALSGSSAAADIPTGKPRAEPRPHSTTPTQASQAIGAKITTTRPTPARTAEPVQHVDAADPADRHGRDKDAENQGAGGIVDSVAVDHGERQPVVRRAL